MYVCPVCKNRYPRPSKLKSYVSLEHIGSDWPTAPPCGQETCLRTFGSLEKWYDHIRRYHKVLEERSAPSPKCPRVSQDSANASRSDYDFDTSSMDGQDDTDDEQPQSILESFQTLKKEIQSISAQFVATLRANSSVTASTCQIAVRLCNDVVETVMNCVVKSSEQFLQEKVPEQDASDLLNLFQEISRPLEFLSDDRKQQRYFQTQEAQYIGAFLMLPWLFRASCGRARKRLNADEPKTSSGGRLFPSTIKNYLICFIEERMSHEEAIEQSKRDGKILQPLILAKTHDGCESIPTELFVVVDYDSFPVEGNFTQAIRLLFMCYWVFGIEYPTEVNLCYYFLENLFEMHGFKPLSPMAKKRKGLNSQSTQLCNQLVELYDDVDEVLL